MDNTTSFSALPKVPGFIWDLVPDGPTVSVVSLIIQQCFKCWYVTSITNFNYVITMLQLDFSSNQ